LAGCECKGESEPIRDERGDLPVHLTLDTVAELGRQAGTRDEAGAIHPALIPGTSSNHTSWKSNTAAVLRTAATTAISNHTTDTVSQLHSKPRRIQSSWSKRILQIMITLMLLLASVLKVVGNSDWRESVFKIQSCICLCLYIYIDRHIFLILSNMPYLFQPLSLDSEDEDVSDSSSEASVNLVFDE